MAATMIWAVLVLSSLALPSLSQTEPDCKRKCGNVTIPYPFGIGDDPKCFQDAKFNLFCNKTFDPPILFMGEGVDAVPVLHISLLEGQATVAMLVATDCYTQDGKWDESKSNDAQLTFNGYRFSETRNKLTAIGCDTKAYISDNTAGREFESSCSSLCRNLDSVSNNSCDGIGCCQTAIPKDVSMLNVTLRSFRNHTQSWSFNPCSYAVLADVEWFKFSISDLKNFTERLSYHRNWPTAPAVLDWAIGNGTCEQAQSGDRAKYACKEHTNCTNSYNGPGYHCYCLEGYIGNPYIGCQDIDECAEKSENKPCEGLCHNTVGSYTCTCPKGQSGDGRNRKRGGSGCTKSSQATPVIPITIGVSASAGVLALVAVGFWLHREYIRSKHIKLKQKFYKRNGGFLLEQQVCSSEGSIEKTKIFDSEDLRKATDNFNKGRILGRGGSGTVYKGMLSDGRIVAIKKSKVVDDSQIGQFINELAILSQINHRSIVKLFGCCLETEVPLLAYEFVSNGTLSNHLHDEEYKSSISWEDRLRIAIEIAGALSYLHSSVSTPIFHRDVKSSNILLDESYRAKISDFGISRSVPYEQTHLTTQVQGTFGYLDPEYFHSSQFTDKSDVYSFGVVLVELLTGEKPILFGRSEEEKNLVMHFVSSVKENRLSEILETRVLNEGGKEELMVVAKLAKRCLNLLGKKRPTMKEVSTKLEGLRKFSGEEIDQKNSQETRYWLYDSFRCFPSDLENEDTELMPCATE